MKSQRLSGSRPTKYLMLLDFDDCTRNDVRAFSGDTKGILY